MTGLIPDYTEAPDHIGAADASLVVIGAWSTCMSDSRTEPASSSHDLPLIGLFDTTSDPVPIWIDLVYRSLHPCVWVAGGRPPPAPSLADLMRDLKDKIDLPVDDVAAMVGIRRRQFYNLLNGRTASSNCEARIRLLHRIVTEVDAALEGDGSRLRAAILMPVGDRYETLYGTAERGDLEDMRLVGHELVRRIEAGEVAGMIQRPAPDLQRLVSPDAAERLRDRLHARADLPHRDGEDDGADS